MFSFKTQPIPKKLIILLLSLCSGSLVAQTRLPAVISTNMVLQRNTRVPVWGWAAPNTAVKVTFAGQSVNTTAGADSTWQVKLAPLVVSNTPQTMIITAGIQQIKLDNILVGDVWLCSGQSNMNYPMDKSINHFTNPAKGTDSAAIAMRQSHPGIRIMKVEMSYRLPGVTSTGWQLCEGRTLERSSAAGFFFARQIHQKLGVPVGIITSAWDGSRIEPWTPPAAYKTLPEFKEDLMKNDTVIDDERAGTMYRSMIKPLAPFALKGIIWYQGESNCMIEEHDMRYACKMQVMIDSWRKLFNANLPFYYTMIAPYVYTEWHNNIPHTIETLPKFWEQQAAAVKIPNTGFVVTTDLVDTITNIHPSYKWIVGERLANLALSKTYGVKGIAYLYPQYDHKKTADNKLVLSFKNAAGLHTADGQSPNFFTIAGADGHFLPARAVIKHNTIILSNPDIKMPVDARFAWTQFAMPNLVNAAGLPAIPFRTNGETWIYQPGL